jgi:hypothetical protein
MSRRALLGLVAAMLPLAAPRARPQIVPAGPEFRVNTHTTNSQARPTVAATGAGSFVVVWESNLQDGSGYGVFAQLYDTAGNPSGTEFRVNSYTTGSQRGPSVAAAGSGFVVVWQGPGQDPDGVSGQRYDSAGAATGAEFRVNSYTTGFQGTAAVAGGAGGGFVVVWRSNAQDGASYGVFGQRYDSAGVPTGGEFRVNSYTTGPQLAPAVSSSPDGSFVVVWHGAGAAGGPGSFGVSGQRYDSAGSAAGPEFPVASYAGTQQLPAVASAPDGRFTAVWDSAFQDGSVSGVFGQRFDTVGARVGPEFLVNTYTTFSQGSARIAADEAGGFMVAWGSDTQDGGFYGVFGQRFGTVGERVGPEFRVNTYTTYAQRFPSVARTGAGSFVVVWQSAQDGSTGYGVYGRRLVDDGLFRDGFGG